MPLLTDLVHQIQMAIDTFWYQILMSLAAFQWSLLRGALMMGYTIQLLTDWLTSQAFAPLIQQTGDSLRVATSWAFVLALFVLGITYMLASIVRLDVVSPRNAILWFGAGLIFFQVGPALYRGMADFRRTVGSAFYLSVLSTLQGQSGTALASLHNVASSDLGILTPCDNFGPYLGRPGGYGAAVVINGLDVALAYLRADGIDVMGYPYPTSDNCQAHVPAQSFAIPWEWQRPGSFFDSAQAPVFFPDLTDEQRAASISLAGAAQWRLFSAWPLVGFGITEQIVALCLTIAQGLTFVSFACVILFAFFKRTEGLAWSLVDRWIETIVQTVVIALTQALVVSFFLAAAGTNNGLVALGVGLICLLLMLLLLRSGLRAIWRSFNGLFEAFGKATGGAVVSVGAAAQTAAGLAGGSLSLVGNTFGGAGALLNGASWSQAAGVALGGSQMLTGAARTLARLPGLHDTALAEAADHFVEGAVTRQVARGVPGAGRLIGPVAGAALLTDRNPENAYEDEAGELHRPMLVPAVGRALAGLTRGPRWPAPDEPFEGEFMPLYPQRLGRFTPLAALPPGEVMPLSSETPATAAQLETAAERSDYVEQETDEELEQHISDVARGTPPAANTEISASKLEQAAERLGQAAEGLSRAAEGRLQVSGSHNVASALGDTLALLGARGAQTADNFAVAGALAGALGVTPLAGGKPPIENDLARFGLFLNQALLMGLNPAQTGRVAQEVKESPEGQLTPDTRSELIRQGQGLRDLSWSDAGREVDTLEHTARVLPDTISAYGLVNLPAPAVTVEANKDTIPEGGAA